MADNGASSYHRFLQGDPEALEQLVREYSDELIRYAYLYVRNSEIAEDVMEDAFAALIVKKKKFKEQASFKAYMYAIVRNRCLDLLRKKRAVPLDDVGNILFAEDGHAALEKRERDRQIYICLNKLAPQYRDALYFTYIDGYSIEETAGIMGKNKKQVYNLLARARSSLKDILIKEGIGYEDL